MYISIVTPTYKRPEYIREMLDSLMAQKIGNEKIEHIVVDNAGCDLTRKIVESCNGANPQITVRYVHEPQTGCNYARNTGIKESGGEYIIFFDDDVILKPGCLQAYIDAFRAYPGQLCFGGRISLKPPEFDLPKWLVVSGDYLRPMIVLSLDFGTENKLQSFSCKIPMTVNMAVNKTVFEKYGVFNPYFGLRGKKLMPGADYELFKRFSRHIDNWIYVADAHVLHPIKKNQCRKHYFRKRLFGVGRVTYRLQRFEARRTLCGMPLYFLSFIARNLCKSIRFGLLGKPVEQFYYETEMLTYCGCVYEHFYKLFREKDISDRTV